MELNAEKEMATQDQNSLESEHISLLHEKILQVSFLRSQRVECTTRSATRVCSVAANKRRAGKQPLLSHTTVATGERWSE